MSAADWVCISAGGSGGSEFGIVSCIAVSPAHQDLLALGSFSRNGELEDCYNHSLT